MEATILIRIFYNFVYFAQVTDIWYEHLTQLTHIRAKTPSKAMGPLAGMYEEDLLGKIRRVCNRHRY